jgi:two-component system LytT family response regulator
MPDLDGFGVVDELSRNLLAPLPHVVFVTAHDEHAVRAFEMHALDFVLKPVSRERFAATVQRARAAIAQRREGGLHDKLMAWIAQERPPAASAAPAAGQRWLERIEVKNPQRWDYVPVADILWMRAGGNYIELVAGGKTHLVRETMHDMEAQLDPALFLRIGRSTMVNLAAVRAIRPAGKGAPMVELGDGTALPVQRNFEQLQQRLQFVRARG